MKKRVLMILFLVVLIPVGAAAHESSTVELTADLVANAFSVEMDVGDIDFVLDLPSADGKQLTVADLQHASAEVRQYLLQGIKIIGCELSAAGSQPGVRTGARPRVVFLFAMGCDTRIKQFDLRSTLVDELGDYRTALTLKTGRSQRLFVLRDGEIQVALKGDSRLPVFAAFLIEGVQHILTGFDHLVFLLLLALPMVRRETFKSCLFAVAGLVTAFSIAHSITLTLSVLGWVSLPAGPVELMIAASIILVALFNLSGKIETMAWPLAYVFGLIHGFGFAGAFAELAAGASIRWTDILAFNIGVELGQIAFIALILLLLRAVTRMTTYGHRLVPVGSVLAACTGLFWVVERL